MLFRKIEKLIDEHLKSNSKKILLIDGARQIGKTYIIRHVGKKLFKNFIEINMVEDSLGNRLFENVKTVEDFYLQVSMTDGEKMGSKEDTLIFIDEIQAYPHLLTLLKFLSQDNKFTYIASGSLRGVTLSQTTSIPMGSIRKVRMFPLDFEEFLYANGMNELVISSMRKKFERLEALAASDYEKVTYTKAAELLKQADVEFKYPVEWGCDLQTEHERYLTEVVYKKPIFVIDYPKEIKAFYMRMNDDGKTVAAMDLLVPGVGEIIGGSQREERLDVLLSRMAQCNLKEEDYWWYVNLRKFGGTKHAGYGLGFERIIMYLTGVSNIRDVIPYPRTVGNADY